jgi:hypothetical protein
MVIFKRGDELRRERDNPLTALSLRFSEDQPTAPAALQSTADTQQPGVHVNVLPPQAQRFALTQAEREPHQPASPHPVTLGRLDEPPRLNNGQRRDLMLYNLGSINQRCRVHRDQLPADRDVQRPSDHRMNVPQARARQSLRGLGVIQRHQMSRT